LKRPNNVMEANHIKVYYEMPTVKRHTLKETIIARLRGEHQTFITKALDDVSVYAEKGECIALVGHNGCGKSTLLKVIAGILQPIAGDISIKGRIAPLIELGAGFDPELSGRENVYLSCSLMGLTRKEISERIEDIKKFSELGSFFDAPIKTYSSGMYMRLGFACTTAIDADLLLIDEILAVGDENFQKKCIKRLDNIRSSGATVILVTHDLNMIKNMADRAYILSHGKVIFEGKSGPVVDLYTDLMEKERLANISKEEIEEEQRQKKLAQNDKLYGDKAQYLAGIISVDILNQKGPTRTLAAGAPWSLEFHIRIHEHLDKPLVAGFAILNSENLRMFGNNTKNIHTNQNIFLQKPGSYKIKFNNDQMPLASGQYSVIAALHNHNLDQTICIIGKAAEFEVTDSKDKNNFDKDFISIMAYKPEVHIENFSSNRTT
jgi:ABC-2 type transport system ATP-binding protein